MFFGPSLEDQYYITPIPGERPGLSASCIGGQSIILNKYISEERRIASGKVIDFFLSWEIQKKNIINHRKYSSIPEIYEDEEVCRSIDCELLKKLQFIARPTNLLPNYNQYSFKFRNIIFDFIYKNAKASETLQKIEDIAAISFISPSSSLGVVVITINGLLFILILSTLVIVFHKKNQFYLKFYDKSSWCLSLFCLCIILVYNCSFLGPLTTFKCYLFQYFTFIGLLGLFYPILMFEIINFPSPNKFSEFVKRYHLQLNFGLIIMDLSYSALAYSLFPSKIKSVYVDDGKNFQKCFLDKTNPQYILFIIMVVSKVLVFPSMAVLSFIEYNLLNIKNEIKTITILLYFNLLYIIFFIIISSFHFEQFYFHSISKIVIIDIIVFINYLCIIWVRMYYEKGIKDDNSYGVKIVKKKHSRPLNNMEGRSLDGHSRSKSLAIKIINYHYYNTSLNTSKKDDSLNKSNTITQSSIPEINLYTGIMTKSQSEYPMQSEQSEQTEQSEQSEHTGKQNNNNNN